MKPIKTIEDCDKLISEFTLDEQAIALSAAKTMIAFNDWAASDDTCCYGVTCLAGRKGACFICNEKAYADYCVKHWATMILLDSRSNDNT